MRESLSHSEAVISVGGMSSVILLAVLTQLKGCSFIVWAKSGVRPGDCIRKGMSWPTTIPSIQERLGASSEFRQLIWWGQAQAA